MSRHVDISGISRNTIPILVYLHDLRDETLVATSKFSHEGSIREQVSPRITIKVNNIKVFPTAEAQTGYHRFRPVPNPIPWSINYKHV